MSRQHAELLVFTALLLRASSFLFNKLGISEIAPLTLLSLRFMLAFLPMVLIFHKRMRRLNRRTLFHGMLLGGICFTMMFLELVGLKTISSSSSCFLESTAIVLIPLFAVFTTKKRPNMSALFCALMAMAGIGLLTLKDGALTLGIGEWLTLLAAIFLALIILLTDRFAKEDDTVLLGILQNGFTGLFALPLAFLFEEPQLPATPQLWSVVVVLVIFCTILGFTLQPVAQRYTTADRVGLLCAIPPMVIMLLDALFMGTTITMSGILGAILIIGSILLSKYLEKKPLTLQKKIHQKNTSCLATDSK